jgi:hypothetical protein
MTAILLSLRSEEDLLHPMFDLFHPGPPEAALSAYLLFPAIVFEAVDLYLPSIPLMPAQLKSPTRYQPLLPSTPFKTYI